MSPDVIRRALDRLGQAGRRLRERPAVLTLDALCRALDGWSAPHSPWRKQLAEALPPATGFSPEVVKEGLARGLAPLHGAALRELVAHELGGVERLEEHGSPRVCPFECTALILAGAVPTPTLIAIVAPLVLRSAVLVKTSRHDPVTARRIAQSLRETDPELGACIEVVSFPSRATACSEALLQADCIVANGSDRTIAALSAAVSPSRRLLTAAHRFSVAVLGPKACRGTALEGCAQGLALDVALWDQLGCLSPVAVYAVDDDPRAADRVADALAAALAQAEQSWPRGHVDAAVAAAIVHERSHAEFRAASGRAVRLLAGPGTTWTVVREDDASLRAAPLHRFVRVHPVPTIEALVGVLRTLGRRLAGVALCGFGDANGALAAQCSAVGASRVCPPGSLQTPPLGWHHEGRELLRPLARFADIEPEGASGRRPRGT